MNDLIQTLNDLDIFWYLLGAGAALVLVDYLFSTDWPAFIGYVCFSLAIFFATPLLVPGSALVAAASLVLLLVLHRFVFSRFLTNSPGAEARKEKRLAPDTNHETPT